MYKSAEFSKNKLQGLLNRAFTKDETREQASKSKQLEELQRLKSICFPKDRDKSRGRDRSFSHFHNQDRSMERTEKGNTSFFHDRTRNLSIGGRDTSQSFLFANHNNTSMNMSPVGKKTSSNDNDSDSSFDRNKSKKDSPGKILDNASPEREDIRTYFQEENWHETREEKVAKTKDNFLTIVDHHTGEMTKFVMYLMNSLKGVCLTKMSEKSINLLMKKYISKLEGLKEQWHNFHTCNNTK